MPKSPNKPTKSPAPSSSEVPHDTPVRVPIHLLHPSPLNPRKTFRDVDLLAESIRAEGLLQNLIARPHPAQPGCYEIAAGERRFRALLHLQASLPPDESAQHLAPYVVIRDLDDAAMLRLALGENGARNDLEPLEEATAFARLEALGEPIRRIAAARGCSPAHVSRRISLLALPAPAQEAIAAQAIPIVIAYDLAQIASTPTFPDALREAIAGAQTLNQRDLHSLLTDRYIAPARAELAWDTDQTRAEIAAKFAAIPNLQEILSVPASRTLLRPGGTHATLDTPVPPAEFAPTYPPSPGQTWGTLHHPSIPLVVAWTPDGPALAVEKELIREHHRELHRTLYRSNPEDPTGPHLLLRAGTPLDCPFPLTESDGGAQKRAAAHTRRLSSERAAAILIAQRAFLLALDEHIRLAFGQQHTPIFLRAALFLVEGESGPLFSLERLTGLDFHPAPDAPAPGAWCLDTWEAIDTLPGFASLCICAGLADTLEYIHRAGKSPLDPDQRPALDAFCAPFDYSSWPDLFVSAWPATAPE